MDNQRSNTGVQKSEANKTNNQQEKLTIGKKINTNDSPILTPFKQRHM